LQRNRPGRPSPRSSEGRNKVGGDNGPAAEAGTSGREAGGGGRGRGVSRMMQSVDRQQATLENIQRATPPRDVHNTLCIREAPEDPLLLKGARIKLTTDQFVWDEAAQRQKKRTSPLSGSKEVGCPRLPEWLWGANTYATQQRVERWEVEHLALHPV
jgi:hypothetical protein